MNCTTIFDTCLHLFVHWTFILTWRLAVHQGGHDHPTHLAWPPTSLPEVSASQELSQEMIDRNQKKSDSKWLNTIAETYTTSDITWWHFGHRCFNHSLVSNILLLLSLCLFTFKLFNSAIKRLQLDAGWKFPKDRTRDAVRIQSAARRFLVRNRRFHLLAKVRKTRQGRHQLTKFFSGNTVKLEEFENKNSFSLLFPYLGCQRNEFIVFFSGCKIVNGCFKRLDSIHNRDMPWFCDLIRWSWFRDNGDIGCTSFQRCSSVSGLDLLCLEICSNRTMLFLNMPNWPTDQTSYSITNHIFVLLFWTILACSPVVSLLLCGS